MFILEILLGLKSMQGDVTCAFIPPPCWGGPIAIQLMFILEILLGLKSMQGDVTCAFILHADLEIGAVLIKN
jgi:hypothetical protein